MADSHSTIVAGIDTGGTFTDLFVVNKGRVSQCKVLSTPSDPSLAIAEGLSRLGLAEVPVHVIHGTTVGTNAVLENKGARVAYVSSEGFADVLSLGRQNREHVYRLEQPEVAPPVPSALCFELPLRILADGTLECEPSKAELEKLAGQIAEQAPEAVAINLLFSFLRPEQEALIADRLGSQYFISMSSRVLPEIREYERGIATWLDASVGPVITAYLHRLAERLPQSSIAVMQSSGTTIAAGQAGTRAVHLLLSGPAGGLSAAQLVGQTIGESRLLTFDMGGTSTDVSLIDGEITLTSQNRIGRWPLGVSSVDIHTIGAGGGSIARVDRAGMLLVGPESAGADPGPVCYGKGGTEVTVTDANLVLGRIPADTLLGGHIPLDAVAAGQAADRLASKLGCNRVDAAAGVIRLANDHMARALRVMSVERRHDPKSCTLFSFGGAGGLHACELAELLGMSRVILPAAGGVLSALGMLASQPGRNRSHAILREVGKVDDEALEALFADLERQSGLELEQEGLNPGEWSANRTMELRYQGQINVLELPFVRGTEHEKAFHDAHEQFAGHRLERAIELVNIRSQVRSGARLATLQPVPDQADAGPFSHAEVVGADKPVPVFNRSDLGHGFHIPGPAIVVEASATSWLAPGWLARHDRWGNLRLNKTEEGD